jgi:histidinol-phosphate aminotransferase
VVCGINDYFNRQSSLGFCDSLISIINLSDQENGMSVSRRQFLGTSTISVAAVPFISSLNIVYCEASMDDSIDWHMGFPEDAIRLNRNENPLGPSPAAIASAQHGVSISNRYAEPATLRSALAEFHGIEDVWLLVGNGSTELLKLAAIVFARHDGNNVVAPLETYRRTPRYAGKLGATPKYIKLLADQNYDFNIEGMLEAVDENTRIFYLVNPNNPTGTILNYDELKAIADVLPKGVLFVIDEAYAQYTPTERNGIDLIKAGYKNVLVTRTFSKAYALAALRCGYGMGHPDIMKKIAPFGAGYNSLNIGAYGALLATLKDHEHLERSQKFAKDTTAYYKTECEKLDLAYVTGKVDLPYILIELGDQTNPIQEELQKRKIWVKKGEFWDLPRYIRVSFGLPKENKAFFNVLRKLL